MKTSNELKSLVQEKYSEIALNNREVNASSCCGATGSSDKVYTIMSEDYTVLDGYSSDADLGLGCGLPTEFAQIKEGDTVVDLGSGAGNDCFIARFETGVTGKVIGVDFTNAMIEKARINADKLGYNNVEFRFGDIENMPISDNTADVIVSNCVLNLVPNKQNVIKDIYRVLKPGGHFSISDIVLVGQLPDELRNDAEMYAGCVAGAIQKADYLSFIEKQGFSHIQIQKEKVIQIPDDILTKYLDSVGIEAFKSGETGIFSITVFAQKGGEKPKVKLADLSKSKEMCAPGSGCC